MSYIHNALLKAQKEKDARFPKYKKILLGPKGKQGVFFKRTVWLISLFVILLVFTFIHGSIPNIKSRYHPQRIQRPW